MSTALGYALDRDFAGLVVYPGGKLEVTLVWACCKLLTSVGEYSLESRHDVCPPARFACLLALDTGLGFADGKGSLEDFVGVKMTVREIVAFVGESVQ